MSLPPGINPTTDEHGSLTTSFLLEGVGDEDEKGVSLWRGAWRRLRRNPSAIIGGALMLAFVLVAIFAPLIAGYEPGKPIPNSGITPSSVPGPSPEHPLGLDATGADLLTQLVYGARQSLVIGVVSTLFGLTIGAAVGLVAGGIGGKVDTVVMRFVDIMLSIPSLLLAVSIAAVLGQSPTSVMIAIGAAQIPIFARLLRGSLLQQRASDYVLASFSLGLRRRSVVMSHMLPNSLGPVIVQATLTLATAIIEVAALSYLGLGDPNPSTAEWGRMLVKAQSRLETDPHLALLPGACIAITALGFTLFGEALRESLDPKFRR
ncbi:MAG TPA: ABC transporter permease [Actinomycetales bacterium]|jgi:peptide/nickel transport system permease protein|nr:ABC transporter permease [Actinomycetales bacterium]